MTGIIKLSVEERLGVIEDREAIRELKAEYCEIEDSGHDAERMVDIFTEDGVWEQEGFGTFTGRDALRTLFTEIAKNIDFMHSVVTNSVIKIDGDEAAGTWSFVGPFQMHDGASNWTFVRYEERYARIGRTWKIKHLRVTRHVTSSRDSSWLP